MQPPKGFHLDRTSMKSIPWSTGVTIYAFTTGTLGLSTLSSCTAPGVPPVATISVNTQQLGAENPKDFLGFSNEVSTSGMGLPNASAAVLTISK